MRSWLLTVLWVAAAAPLASASEREDRALNNLQHETTSCAAFYNVMLLCARDEQDPLHQRLAASAQTLTERALKLGRAAGMTIDAMVARASMAAEQQRALLNNNCANAASLLTRYGVRCKAVSETPDAVYEEYLAH